ncbi:phospholipid-metabolizing enzyme A-C1-like isoform X2 [Hippocampus comes]|nr:PREDICTED: phospholipid-metabolizing enzyme A-C1-like isoform X1 [Hippocampus comes]XP_019727032.1 PREDICTED: phospholipid-metabolizing enzyme A-C1-like isoform X1 [Hippocampus comes]XP_019727033.1 PREDICTED: phospholipid-metabolizing enzyme A-C1-like isoform X1 [Hippocampus comes]XP_019727034.1 PREDICTED: phospholipid-metabolizing enzyme A-C1-like isoform X2 [Hippocampus comes]
MDLEAQIEEIASSAQFGDLIEFSYPIGYSHWGVYDDDKHVIHFAVADEGQLMYNFRTSLQTMFPLCGDLLLGATCIRRVPLSEVTVPSGVHILISNNRHAFNPSSPEEMRRRRDALEDEELTYNLFWLNCEHFATFVRYGKAVCNQIPTKPKNVETKSATKAFNKIVDAKYPNKDPS